MIGARPRPPRMKSPRDTSLLGQLRRQRGAYLLGTILLFARQAAMYGRDQLFRRGVDAASNGAGQAAGFDARALAPVGVAGNGRYN